jgi:protein TonB
VIVTARVIADTHTIPNYPPLSVRLGQTGDVRLKLTIDERGAVVAATVEKSSGYDALDNAAVAWVIAHWRYEPATKDGKPFATTTDAQVTFRLTGR